MEAYIISGYRSAIGKANKGSFKNYRSDDLAVEVIKHLLAETPEITPEMVDDVIVGCANPEGEQGLQIGRQIALRALGESVPGVTVNRYCGSGLDTIGMAASKIAAGMGDIYIAGGTENMSMIPMTGYKLAPSYEVANNTPDYVVSMGITAEEVAEKYNISREAADEFAVRSHQRAQHAIESGYYDDEIVPIEVTEVTVKDGKRHEETFTVTKDEGVRPGTNMEVLSKLRPAFRKDGVVTAGNSSQTSDGAAFVLVVSKKIVEQYNLKPIAKLLAVAVAGVDPLYMGIGPVAAIPKALKQAGLSLDQIDLIELNEAFATQSLAVIQEAGLDPEKVNVNGGAIAMGHPLGCTGAKLTISLLSEMERRNAKYGMVTACIGGGQGIAGIYELLTNDDKSDK